MVTMPWRTVSASTGTISTLGRSPARLIVALALLARRAFIGMQGVHPLDSCPLLRDEGECPLCSMELAQTDVLCEYLR